MRFWVYLARKTQDSFIRVYPEIDRNKVQPKQHKGHQQRNQQNANTKTFKS